MTQLPIPVHVGSEPPAWWDDIEAGQREFGMRRHRGSRTSVDGCQRNLGLGRAWLRATVDLAQAGGNWFAWVCETCTRP